MLAIKQIRHNDWKGALEWIITACHERKGKSEDGHRLEETEKHED